MVDRQARQILYDEMIAYLHGYADRKRLITLYQRVETQDMGVWEIEDRLQHIPLDKVSGSPPRLKRRSDQPHVVRMLLFALEDDEYAWPEEKRDTPATCLMSIFLLATVPALALLWFYRQYWMMLAVGALLLAVVALFDRVRRRQVDRWQLHGDIDAWPFIRLEDYQRAAERHLAKVESDLPRSMRS
jgi:hypothetical protein